MIPAVPGNYTEFLYNSQAQLRSDQDQRPFQSDVVPIFWGKEGHQLLSVNCFQHMGGARILYINTDGASASSS